MSSNAPPGGGPGAVVFASSHPHLQTPAPAPVDDPNLPPTPNPAPAQPQPPAAPIAADPNALTLEPAPATPPAAPAPASLPDFGDNGLNVAADYFVNTLGLDINGRELTEAAAGNFALLEAKIEVLGDKAKGAGPILRLAQDAVARVKASETARHNETVKLVHETVGGEANWKAVQHYARTNLPPDQLEQASQALTQGGLVAQAMAQHLLRMASTHPQATITGTPASNPASGVSEALQGVAPLTRQQYRAEYRKLVEKMGITAASRSDELKALNARVIN